MNIKKINIYTAAIVVGIIFMLGMIILLYSCNEKSSGAPPKKSSTSPSGSISNAKSGKKPEEVNKIVQEAEKKKLEEKEKEEKKKLEEAEKKKKEEKTKTEETKKKEKAPIMRNEKIIDSKDVLSIKIEDKNKIC